MILGVGTDLCDIRRIEKSLDQFGDRFVERLFTEGERARAERKPNPAAAYAQRFAAKEALAKALGTGFRDGVFFKDIEVANHPSGQPFLKLSGGALARLEALTPPGWRPHIDLSLTDEFPMAHAMVILSAER
ncbi:MAG: holo-ACP synthase [Magnetospirillum sp. WYHS-4]